MVVVLEPLTLSNELSNASLTKEMKSFMICFFFSKIPSSWSLPKHVPEMGGYVKYSSFQNS